MDGKNFKRTLVIFSLISILLVGNIPLTISSQESLAKIDSDLIKSGQVVSITHIEHEKNESIDSAKLSKVRLPFIKNEGQTNDQVKFYANTFAGTIFITEKGLTYSLVIDSDTEVTSILVIKENFASFNELKPYGLEKSKSVVNYFVGNKDDWRSSIPTFDSIGLGEVWSLIDVELKAYGNNIEKVFKVAPGGNVDDISVKLDGVDSLAVADNGQLLLKSDSFIFSMTSPIAYQYIDGEKVEVVVSYDVEGTSYGFVVNEYDPNYTLIIDPLLASTYLGTSGEDFGTGIDVDSSGNIFVTGITLSLAYPTTTGVFDETHNGGKDAFVSKFTDDLTTLSASTFLGGSDDEESPSITIDGTGNLYVVGTTVSSDYPTTSGAFDETHNGASDIFVSKLTNDLSTLSASTFLGGSLTESSSSIASDSSGNVFVVGRTSSNTYPTTSGAFDQTFNGFFDVIVSKLTDDLTTLSASTFIGDTDLDLGVDIALDSSNNIFVTGTTTSVNYPTTTGVFDETHNGGGADAFVSKLTDDLTTLSASTFLGGGDSETVGGLGLDGSGNVFISGGTGSINYPTTAGAFDETKNTITDGFISKFSNDLVTLSASTFIAGSAILSLEDLTLDSSNNVFVTGSTFATNYPVTTGVIDETHNGGSDVVVSKLTNDLTTLSASTFVGGSASDRAPSMVIDALANVILTGRTFSSDFPTSTGVFDETFNGNSDSFVFKVPNNLQADLPPDTITDLSATVLSSSQIELTWTEPPNRGTTITGYQIERESPVGGGFSVIVANTASTATTFTDSSLPTGTEFNYRVSAINAFGTGQSSNEASATTLGPPSAITDLLATAISSTEISLSWTIPSDNGSPIIGYQIERESPTGGGFSVIVANTGSTANSFSDLGLIPGNEYNYRVSAINAVGIAPLSNQTAVTLINNPPIANDDSLNIFLDTPIVNFEVKSNDNDPDGFAITVTSVSDPPNGSTSITPTNGITYTPDQGFSGLDSFSYTISDEQGETDMATVNVNVHPIKFLFKINNNGGIDVATDQEGNIYGFLFGSLSKFNPGGGFISFLVFSGFSDGKLINPFGVTVDDSGRIYITEDNPANRVQVFDFLGNFLFNFGDTCDFVFLPANCTDPDGAGPLELGDGQFSQPVGVAIEETTGNIYVVDSRNFRIEVFDSSGNFLFKFGSSGSGDGQFFGLPLYIAFNSAGNLLVTDERRVQELDPSGNFVSKFGTACKLSTGIGCLDPDGPGPLETGDGQFDRATGITVDSSDRIYVGDSGNSRIQVFDSSGNFLFKFGSLCIISTSNGCIDPDGDGPLALGDGQFGVFELGMAEGSILVLDTLNSRLQAFGFDVPPTAPTELTAKLISSTEVKLSWNEPFGNGSPITGYQIERESPIGSGFNVLVADTGSTSTTFTDSGLALNTEFNYRVSAINQFGVGPSSNEAAEASINFAPLTSSTFIGGIFSERSPVLKLDSSGNVFVASTTQSPDYPTTVGVFDETRNGVGSSDDVVISKLDRSLTSLLASTYLGGIKSDRVGDIAIDSSGNVIVTGLTFSSDYPTTAGAFDETFDAITDVFVSKLTNDLTTLSASTLLTGSSSENGESVIIDGSDNIIVAGTTRSSDFPTTAGAFDTTFNGNEDVFISKLDTSLTSLLASTFIGGNSQDRDPSVIFDSSGNILVTGQVASSNFPTTSGAFDETFNAGSDGFISKFDNSLTSLLASTYIGGKSSLDRPEDIGVDSSGNVIITGVTASFDYPTTSGAFDETINSRDTHAFVSKLTNDLTTLSASTFIGGKAASSGFEIAIDSSDNIFVIGTTRSSDFPITSGAFDISLNGISDGFISKFDNSLTSLLASTYIGASPGNVFINNIVVDPFNDLIIVGNTNSPLFPTTAGAFDETFNGQGDVFVSRFTNDLTTGSIADLSITKSDNPDPVNEGSQLTYTLTINNGGPDDAENVIVTDTLPAEVSLVSVSSSQGSCTSLPCNLGTIISGSLATVTIIVNVGSSTTGSLTNTASVSSSAKDTDTSNNDASEITQLILADLSITKTDVPDPVDAGTQLTYTLSVNNDGPNNAENVIVTDTLPAEVSLVSVSSSQGSCTSLPCNLGTLINGASATVTIIVTVDSAASSSLTNTASVSSTTSEPNPTNNSVVETTGIISSSATIDDNVTIGQGSVIGTDSIIKVNVVIGDNAVIGNNVEIKEDSSIGDNFQIGDNSQVKESTIIGNNVQIGDNSQIKEQITIGDNVQIGNNTQVKEQITIGNNVVIGNNVQIGERSIILDGAVVPDGTMLPPDSTFS